MRINKYLALKAEFSRREADKAIAEGRVNVNGSPITIGYIVSNDDVVEVDGKRIEEKHFVYLAFNKPRGIVTSSPYRGQKSIADILKFKSRVFPVGRLDKESEGLILLTNDPTLTERALYLEKEYEVTVNKPITKDFIEKLKQGIFIPVVARSGATQQCLVKAIRATKRSDKTFSIILREGKNRQIRKMCQALGYRVLKLTRIRIAKLKLNELPPGKYRELDNMII